jgi:hypothetical protein
MHKRWLLTGLLLLLLDWVASTEPAYSHHPGILLTGFGTAKVDGLMIIGEWDGASKIEFLANVPANDGGGTTPATLYVMNDDTTLYLAVKITRSSFGGATSAFFEFDNNHQGERGERDDVFGTNVGILSPAEFFDDFRTFQPPCPMNSLCGFLDVDFGGTNDGNSAASNDGEFTVLEISHPLNSGDLRDFAVLPGDRIGFSLFLRLFALNPTCGSCFADLADTYFPSSNAALFGDIVIAPTFPLTVAKLGSGSGTVISSVGVINCGLVCDDLYGPGTVVNLSAAPAQGSSFAGWSGCDSVTDHLCSVNVDSETEVTAIFVTPLVIGRHALAEGEVGVRYDVDFPLGGGMAPYNVSIIKGALPPGLRLNSTRITGEPTDSGSAHFTLRITDQLGAVISRPFRIKVARKLGISTDSLKEGTVGRKYRAVLKADGGQKPFLWSLISGQLPPGLGFDAETGKISGIPTVAGSTNLTFQTRDRLGGIVETTLTLTIN